MKNFILFLRPYCVLVKRTCERAKEKKMKFSDSQKKKENYRTILYICTYTQKKGRNALAYKTGRMWRCAGVCMLHLHATIE